MTGCIYQDVRQWALDHGIRVTERSLDAGKAGEFTGIAVTMNVSYSTVEQAYYLVHSLGSIVRWSLSHDDVQAMFDELRAAKKEKQRVRLESAIERYRAFEIESSEFAVWLLAHVGHKDSVPSYSNFMRADLEALTVFHRTGHAPVWKDFFAQWNQEVAVGYRQVNPFSPKEIPPFEPHSIENQEILQKQAH